MQGTRDTPGTLTLRRRGTREPLGTRPPGQEGPRPPGFPVVAVGPRRHMAPAPAVPSRWPASAHQGRASPGHMRPPPRRRWSWSRAGHEHQAPAQGQGVPWGPRARAQPQAGWRHSRCLPDAAVGGSNHPVLADQRPAAEVEPVGVLVGRAAVSTRHRRHCRWGALCPAPAPAPSTAPSTAPTLLRALTWRETCHGQDPGTAGSPLTMRV